ncbi:LysR family transcriptional regulator [Streptomyces sp. RS10V-4]|uniref:LysR family transcriptional regulator n=1 Tax=Streptomyces rhizoryzae TaxID=2932493 RepID=UPI0020058C91|nr:LysR family transcriptional regulator [Streptomyces rhizoryzae]MCK7622812.1 LysR family transcriptional regulator [Streptomyces rhizoryzae]
MDVRQLQYFLAVVDHGGFTRAATALYVAQPSLSQTIRTLERDLGTQLFHRLGRTAVLTGAGAALIEPARAAVRSLELARATVAAVHGLDRGRVDIAALPSQAVEPLTGLIRRFAQRYPRVSVAVQSAATPRDVTERVRTGAAELGLVAVPGPLGEGWPAGDPGQLRYHPLGEQRFVLLAPPGGPFAAGAPVRREELAGQRLIVGQPGTGMRQYADALRSDGVDWTVAVETEHRVAIVPLVLGGVGLAVVTDAWREPAERAGALVLDLEPAAGLHLALVSRRTAPTPAARAFLDGALEAGGGPGRSGPAHP